MKGLKRSRGPEEAVLLSTKLAMSEEDLESPGTRKTDAVGGRRQVVHEAEMVVDEGFDRVQFEAVRLMV